MEHILHLVESVFEIATHYLGPSPLVILKLADATIVCRLCWGIFIICSVFFALNDSGFLNRMERLLLSISLSVCAAIMTPDWFVVAVAVVVCFFCRVMGGLFCGLGLSLALIRLRSRRLSLSLIGVGIGENVFLEVYSVLLLALSCYGAISAYKKYILPSADVTLRPLFIGMGIVCISGILVMPAFNSKILSWVYLLAFPLSAVIAFETSR